MLASICHDSIPASPTPAPGSVDGRAATEEDRSKGLRYGRLVAVGGLLLVAQAVIAAQGITGNLVDVRWLEQHRLDPDVLILDASLAPAYGAKHMPGALNVDAMTYGGKEAPIAETERLYQSWGVSLGKRIVMYDQGGTFMATRLFFALKFILGYPNVKLYAESELGWLSDPRELPYWTYDAPYLMRDSRWLQWTGGQMVRTYLGAPVSVVDVRPADAFNQGHVPFALNIPGGVSRRHVGSPEKLAEALGAAGVDAALEAVVVSGAGLTPDAALAFLLLEQAGQTKASVFMDSMDGWAKQGFTVAKTPTAVGPKKAPGDLTIEPKTYPVNVRTGIVISDPTATQGLYPKVFIASGKAMPARVQDGIVVHVPYTELLNPGGTPRAAKDIWNILTKAGVPRYAELVCLSDEPGEAAVNYVILKLMGYPDIKVLVM